MMDDVEVGTSATRATIKLSKSSLEEERTLVVDFKSSLKTLASASSSYRQTAFTITETEENEIFGEMGSSQTKSEDVDIDLDLENELLADYPDTSLTEDSLCSSIKRDAASDTPTLDVDQFFNDSVKIPVFDVELDSNSLVDTSSVLKPDISPENIGVEALQDKCNENGVFENSRVECIENPSASDVKKLSVQTGPEWDEIENVTSSSLVLKPEIYENKDSTGVEPLPERFNKNGVVFENSRVEYAENPLASDVKKPCINPEPEWKRTESLQKICREETIIQNGSEENLENPLANCFNAGTSGILMETNFNEGTAETRTKNDSIECVESVCLHLGQKIESVVHEHQKSEIDSLLGNPVNQRVSYLNREEPLCGGTKMESEGLTRFPVESKITAPILASFPVNLDASFDELCRPDESDDAVTSYIVHEIMEILLDSVFKNIAVHNPMEVEEVIDCEKGSKLEEFNCVQSDDCSANWSQFSEPSEIIKDILEIILDCVFPPKRTNDFETVPILMDLEESPLAKSDSSDVIKDILEIVLDQVFLPKQTHLDVETVPMFMESDESLVIESDSSDVIKDVIEIILDRVLSSKRTKVVIETVHKSMELEESPVIEPVESESSEIINDILETILDRVFCSKRTNVVIETVHKSMELEESPVIESVKSESSEIINDILEKILDRVFPPNLAIINNNEKETAKESMEVDEVVTENRPEINLEELSQVDISVNSDVPQFSEASIIVSDVIEIILDHTFGRNLTDFGIEEIQPDNEQKGIGLTTEIMKNDQVPPNNEENMEEETISSMNVDVEKSIGDKIIDKTETQVIVDEICDEILMNISDAPSLDENVDQRLLSDIQSGLKLLINSVKNKIVEENFSLDLDIMQNDESVASENIQEDNSDDDRYERFEEAVSPDDEESRSQETDFISDIIEELLTDVIQCSDKDLIITDILDNVITGVVESSYIISSILDGILCRIVPYDITPVVVTIRSIHPEQFKAIKRVPQGGNLSDVVAKKPRKTKNSSSCEVENIAIKEEVVDLPLEDDVELDEIDVKPDVPPPEVLMGRTRSSNSSVLPKTKTPKRIGRPLKRRQRKSDTSSVESRDSIKDAPKASKRKITKTPKAAVQPVTTRSTRETKAKVAFKIKMTKPPPPRARTPTPPPKRPRETPPPRALKRKSSPVAAPARVTRGTPVASVPAIPPTTRSRNSSAQQDVTAGGKRKSSLPNEDLPLSKRTAENLPVSKRKSASLVEGLPLNKRKSLSVEELPLLKRLSLQSVVDVPVSKRRSTVHPPEKTVGPIIKNMAVKSTSAPPIRPDPQPSVGRRSRKQNHQPLEAECQIKEWPDMAWSLSKACGGLRQALDKVDVIVSNKPNISPGISIQPCRVILERSAFIDRLLPKRKDEGTFCELCEPKRWFLTKYGLVDHLKTEHAGTFGAAESSAVVATSLAGDCVARCPGCDKKYHSNNRLTMHMRTCPAVVNSAQQMTHDGISSAAAGRPVEKEMRYTCEVCNNKFSLWSAYEAHKRNHWGDRVGDPLDLEPEPGTSQLMYESDMMRRGQGLKMTIRRERLPVLLYRCDECKAPFDKPETLAIHKNTHKVKVKQERLSPELEILEEYIAPPPILTALPAQEICKPVPVEPGAIPWDTIPVPITPPIQIRNKPNIPLRRLAPAMDPLSDNSEGVLRSRSTVATARKSTGGINFQHFTTQTLRTPDVSYRTTPTARKRTSTIQLPISPQSKPTAKKSTSKPPLRPPAKRVPFISFHD